MKRRDFIKKATLAAGVVALKQMLGDVPDALGNQDTTKASKNTPQIARRAYGKTGVKLSIIGFGGIVVINSPQKHANKVVAEAVEKGVNYFDVAPTYGNGEAEAKLGPALEPYRKKSFLACKTTQRDRPGAAAELKQSLKRLRTDYFDLYQLHAINDVQKDVDAAFAKGGAMETFIEAKKSGQVRFLGFSAHSEEAALAAMDRYDFDSILFPVNFACFYQGKFGPKVIEKAKAKSTPILALKTIARGKWPENDPERQKYGKCWYKPISDLQEAELALKFTLSQGVTAAIPPGEEALFQLALDLAMNIKILTEQENKKIIELAKTIENPLFTRTKT